MSELAQLLPRGRTLPDDAWRRRHLLLALLLLAHAPVLGAFAAWRAAHGELGLAHGLVEGIGAPAVLGLLGLQPHGGRKLRSAIVAAGLLTCSALVVHFSGGYIEAHFHFFVIMVILGLYEDWLPFGLALGYVVLHHGIVGAVSPENVYNHPEAIAHPWRWAAIHGVAISAAGLLSIAAWRLNEELRERLRARETELAAANRDLQELDLMKSEFVAMASHELRTPLTSIAGFATTLRAHGRGLDDDQHDRFLAIIEEQSYRLGSIVSEMLDLSRIESGEIGHSPRAVGLREEIERAVVMIGEGSIEVACDPEVAAHVDPAHLRQILTNYLANARKYGAEPILVSAQEENGAVEVRVRDFGQGVPEEFVPHLFSRFARARDLLGTGEGSGTGLGLAIVRGLARVNGGDAWYERPNGVGACFAVRFPRGGTLSVGEPHGSPTSPLLQE